MSSGTGADRGEDKDRPPALAKEHKWPNPPLGYDRTEDGRLAVNRREARLYIGKYEVAEVSERVEEYRILMMRFRRARGPC